MPKDYKEVWGWRKAGSRVVDAIVKGIDPAVGFTAIVLMEVNMALVLIACVITGIVLGHRVAVSLGVAS